MKINSYKFLNKGSLNKYMNFPHTLQYVYCAVIRTSAEIEEI